MLVQKVLVSSEVNNVSKKSCFRHRVAYPACSQSVDDVASVEDLVAYDARSFRSL